MAAPPSQIITQLTNILTGSWEELTLTKVLALLQANFEGDINQFKDVINREISLFIKATCSTQRVQHSPMKLVVKKSCKRKSDIRSKSIHSKRKREEGGDDNRVDAGVHGLNRPVAISAVLAKFVKVAPGAKLARSKVVKFISEYVKNKRLQDPADRRHIICDSNLKALLGEDRVTFFTLNKYLSQHFEKPDKAKLKRKPKKERPSPAATMQLSSTLEALTGQKELSQQAVVQEVWNYIKANNLQEEDNRRVINCDETLFHIFGKPKIDMNEMNKAISLHMFPLARTR